MKPEPQVLLEVEQLALERGDTPLLEDLSFALRAGDCLRISGANGVGKTTLLRTLCGISRPARGTVRWSQAVTEPGNAKNIIYLGHLTGMKDALTVTENLQVFGALHGIRENDSLTASIARVGLGAMASRRFQNLSAGQRRRVALAGLCMSPANVWLLDEPFTALDPEGIHIMESMVDEHLANQGCAIFTAHSSTGPLSDARVLELEQYKCEAKPGRRLHGYV